MASEYRTRGTWLCASMAIAMCAVGCEERESGEEEPDAGEDPGRLYPGPCTATEYPEGGAPELDCIMGYDDSDRMTSVECTERDGTSRIEVTRIYTGDELTEVSSLYEVRPGSPGAADRVEERTWTLGETITSTAQIDRGASGTYEVVQTYEREGFQFIGHPFDPERIPDAPDSLVSASSLDAPEPFDIDYTYDGPPRQGTRTRTGSDGSIVVFGYDAAGRLRERSSTNEIVTNVYTYDYVGDLLSNIDLKSTIKGGSDDTRTMFEHDVHGNLIAKRYFPVDPPTHIMELDYACW